MQAWGAIALDTKLPVEVSRHVPSSEDDASLLKLTQVLSHLAQYASLPPEHDNRQTHQCDAIYDQVQGMRCAHSAKHTYIVRTYIHTYVSMFGPSALTYVASERERERERETSARNAILPVGTHATGALTASIPEAEEALFLTRVGCVIKAIARRTRHPVCRNKSHRGARGECCHARPIVVTRPAKALPAVVRARTGRIVSPQDGIEPAAPRRPSTAFGSPRAA